MNELDNNILESEQTERQRQNSILPPAKRW